jgi:sugar O-acyltransferase (sialic acid O-acetyltransferase NeuD family)
MLMGACVTKYIIVGSGGHARSILDTLVNFEGTELFVLSHPDVPTNFEATLISEADAIQNQADFSFVIGIGKRSIRNRVIPKLLDVVSLKRFPPVIHPTAYISKSAQIGFGSQILGQSYIGPNTVIGNFALLNTRVVIEHDSKIGHQSVISPGVIVAGSTSIGENCFVGIGAKITNDVSIGSGSTISANVFVSRDLHAKSFISNVFSDGRQN